MVDYNYVNIVNNLVSNKLNGVTLVSYDEGDKTNPAILLIMGHGSSMLAWPIETFKHVLIDAGFRVITFDNRDSGNSKLEEESENFESKSEYDMEDMANDAIAILDHYAVDKAHLLGPSMGGLIA